VAPLKPDAVTEIAYKAVQFPRLQKRGPIEAQRILRWALSGAPVSTLTKAWPH